MSGTPREKLGANQGGKARVKRGGWREDQTAASGSACDWILAWFQDDNSTGMEVPRNARLLHRLSVLSIRPALVKVFLFGFRTALFPL